jgi:transcriptional regulator with XRE-family HTH domain
MTPKEFETAMDELGLTQGKVAKKLGVRPETVNRWLRGISGKMRNDIPGPAAAAMKSWLDEKRRITGSPLSGPEGSMV